MTKLPYDPDKLPPDLQKLLPCNTRRSTPTRTYLVSPQKSYAQVETLVSPPKSGGLKPMRKKRRNPLTVRLSDGDREHIRQKAKQAGCTLNSFVRASVLGSRYTPQKDPELAQSLLKLNLELTRQGINLNQIARQINAGNTPSEIQIALLIRSTLQIHKAIRQAIAKGEMGEE